MTVATIIARNYVSYARVLAESFAEHHPGRRLAVLIVDADVTGFDASEEPFELVRPSELPIEADELRKMATIYDALELSTALKPWLLAHLLERGEPVVYLDPDIEIFAPLEELDALANQHSIVLVPHMRRPIPADGRRPTAADIAVAGVYNLGFIAVGERARSFLDWWGAALRRDCIVAVEEGLFVDQRLLDFVPGFFEHHVLRDPAYDVAYWNLHERDVERSDGSYTVEGAPLRFFHYSGFDPLRPTQLSIHQGATPRVVLDERPVVARLCLGYAERLLRAGYRETIDAPYGFGVAANGLRLDRRVRRLYRQSLLAAERGDGVDVPDAFDPEQVDAFAEWYASGRALDALTPLDRARYLLEVGPDVSSPKWWVPYARRAVLRILRHANMHRDAVYRALAEAIADRERLPGGAPRGMPPPQ